MPRPAKADYRPDQFDLFAEQLDALAQDLRTQASRVRDAKVEVLEVQNCTGMEEAPRKIALFVSSIAKALQAVQRAELDAKFADSKQHTVLRVAEEVSKFPKGSKSKK